MIKKILDWFRKDEDLQTSFVPKDVTEIFILMLDNITIGQLYCKDGLWHFKYDDEFKKIKDQYYTITGFSDVDKVYVSEILWPFFQIRIPGLGQPLIKEIIEKEGLDKNNELEMLKRFGKKVISNPYILNTA